ncbi:MAG: type II secretion system F family protein [Betaproteobacteria bacterium]|nr:type II secretion system F family protein [Betaproteobacteria bacterium]
MAIDLKSPSKATVSAGHAPKRKLNPVLFASKRISLTDRMLFTERLALLIQTGVSLLEALHVMEDQTEQPAVANVISALAQSISEGKSFSVALASHPGMFSTPYISLVGAAEEGGFLGPVLEQLQQADEKAIQLRSDTVSTLSYPAFLICFSFVVVVFVLMFIFPKFDDLFTSIRKDLPPTTVVLLATSRFLLVYWPHVLGVFSVVVWAVVAWIKSPAGQLMMDRAKIGIPILGELYVMGSLVQLLSVLGLSLTNGVPITVALKACQDVVKNSVFVALIEDMRAHVNEGRGLSIGFRNAPFIPLMVKQMVSTGEETGNLGLVLTRIATFYEKDLNKRIQIISKSIEPIMLLVMGVVVGLIVASLILPIFKLSRAAG